MSTNRIPFHSTRRDFLKVSVAGVAAALAPWSRAEQTATAGTAELKLCSQEGKIPGKTLRERIEKLEAWGAKGIEFGGNPAGRIKEIKEALKGSNLHTAALCWGSCNGDLVSMDLEKRAKGIAALKSTLDTAGELESTGVIFVPCFHKQSTLQPDELRKILIEIFPAIGDHAKSRGTRVLLEPLNSAETFYMKRLEQAASICDELNNPGIAMMGDFYHMGREEKSDKDAFVRAGRHLHHVHLATKARVLPGQDERSFVDGFRGLKLIGYRDYCSLECGIRGKADEEIPKAFKFLQQQWNEATV